MTVPTPPHPSLSSTPSTANAVSQPDRISLALKAMGECRWDDAAKHIAAIPDSPLSAYAWKMYLGGWLAAERQDYTTAEASLLPAVSAALVNSLGDEQQEATDLMLLAAAALNTLGLIYRRQERLDTAYRAHLAALSLRQEHGSLDLQWESAMNLAVDCAVARRGDEAQRWCRTAVRLATLLTERPSAQQAESWSRLSTVLASLGRHDDAVASARTARDCWHKFNRSDVAAARADLTLAHALIQNGEAVYGTDVVAARRFLDEALSLLTTAAEELPPFGLEAAADVRQCAEQTDFARRLLASLED